MKRIIIFLLLTISAICLAQTSPLKSGSAVYIEPMGGYENYLAAAFVKERVPVVVVTQRDKADFFVQSTVYRNVPAAPVVAVNNSATVNEGQSGNNQAWNQGWATGQQAAARRAALGYSDASIAIVSAKTSQIVFAYSATKGGTNQLEKTAENCAKHLKKTIEKSERPKK